MSERKVLRALVVDDNEINLMVCEELLQEFSFEVHMADSGFRAIEIAENNHFDIVFLDNEMPEMNGLETCRRLRALPNGWSTVSIIALTGHDVDDHKEQYKAAGMTGWLTKPLALDALTEVLKNALGDRIGNARDAVAEDTPAWFHVLATVPLLDPIKGISFLRNQYTPYRKLLSAFLLQVEFMVPILEACVSQGELRRYAIEAHSFKGSLTNIGASSLASAARELEVLADAGDINAVKEKNFRFALNLSVLAGAIKEALNADVPPQETMPVGDMTTLGSRLQLALERLLDFETGDTIEIIAELRGFHYTADIDSQLRLIEAMMDSYSYELAVSKLEKMISMVMGEAIL